MTICRLLVSCMALLMAITAGPSPAGAAERAQTVAGPGFMFQPLDVWKVKCIGAAHLKAGVSDGSGGTNNVLHVTVVGISPASIKGDAAGLFTDPGGSVFQDMLFAPVNTTIEAFVLISSGLGSTAYFVQVQCLKKNGTEVEPSVFTLVQNQ